MPAVSDRVYRIHAPYDGNAVHLYLVRGAQLALIDSGASDSPSAAVEPALRELGLQWSDLDFLLNTHGQALRQLGPDASFSALAEAACRELVFDMPIQFDRRTIVNLTAARAIRAHLTAHGWEATPAEVRSVRH